VSKGFLVSEAKNSDGSSVPFDFCPRDPYK